ncbi:hypothetical protein IscW_ISCW021857 [Ixodes scapularis]|uniref:Uncharacterized protein n=1 Tax=Ixodes scapularis TaxID=6945 RepID=B7Q5K3_IXOSC|nr:hypothetical protein IscW_ISCW021857 [Ixodes scapularis]|eukprot:XP_002411786.1 hypothetical protein IscW_ISCW021857 [Ixodes scapularis]
MPLRIRAPTNPPPAAQSNPSGRPQTTEAIACQPQAHAPHPKKKTNMRAESSPLTGSCCRLATAPCTANKSESRGSVSSVHLMHTRQTSAHSNVPKLGTVIAQRSPAQAGREPSYAVAREGRHRRKN